MLELIELFLTFAKIGMFTFGGGYAMISIIDNICVEEKKWITEDEMMNITVISQSTPGPVAINCSTFVGYKRRGFIGAIFATVGVIVPSFIMIYLLSMFFSKFLELSWVSNAFSGIKIAVGILILDAGVKMLKQMEKNKMTIAIATISLILMVVSNVFVFNVSVTLLMALSSIFGLVMFIIKKHQKGM
ncbi:chromate transporter [Lachnospiraceae bacterium C7]|nr:chromate transporter [Lachnospiraceae bacterium C7]